MSASGVQLGAGSPVPRATAPGPARAGPVAARGRFSTLPYADRFGSLVRPGMRVLITGGSGFIGTNLVDFYHRAGARVVNVDIKPPRDETHRALWTNLDIRDRDAYVAAAAAFDPELFLHLAARTDLDEADDLEGYAANTRGTSNTLVALEALRNVRLAILTSTQLVCEPGYTPQREDDYRPHTLYGQSKVIMERLVRGWKKPSCPWTMVRPTSIWGPWFAIPYKTFFLQIARRMYFHQRGVNARRSFGFVGNAVYQYAAMANAPTEQMHGQTFYMANNDPVLVRDWADLIQREMGIRPLREIPLSWLRLAARVGDLCARVGWKSVPITSFRLKNLTGDNICDMTPVRRLVGDMPFGDEEGVQITVRWMREEGSVPGAG
ncbi:MAG: NAD-dependent epimerase/dehydratase family protein [Phycisphaerae bacterium]|nr:NAD-dependent epimerase/dehydratase family protein [Phycisphaerae bacterium]